MNLQPRDNARRDATAFVEGARQQRPGLVTELIDFVRNSKKWWLTPVLLLMLIMGVLIFLSGTPAAPFIYTLF
jgi:Family of unknown function (DUF5989)